MLRVILEPLIGDVPIVGALTMFFIRRPVSNPSAYAPCDFSFCAASWSSYIAFCVCHSDLQWCGAYLPALPCLTCCQSCESHLFSRYGSSPCWNPMEPENKSKLT